MSVKERVKDYAKCKNVSIREFERESGLNYGYINSIRVSIQPEKLEGIASHYNDLNISWLLTGEGNMLKKKEADVVGIISSQQETINRLTRIIENLTNK